MRILIGLALISAVLTAPAYSQSGLDKGQMVTIEGEITSLDWVAGIIVVRYVQYDPVIMSKDVTFFVPQDMKIAKGADTITFSELNQFDRVRVT